MAAHPVLLGYDAMLITIQTLTFRRNVLSPLTSQAKDSVVLIRNSDWSWWYTYFSWVTLKMEVTNSFETLVRIYQYKLNHAQEERKCQHFRENVESRDVAFPAKIQCGNMRWRQLCV
jgi:hypothetical protein